MTNYMNLQIVSSQLKVLLAFGIDLSIIKTVMNSENVNQRREKLFI